MIRILLLAVMVVVAGSPLVFAGDDFAGKWMNKDDKSGGLTRLEISKNGKAWTIQVWGAGIQEREAGGGDEIDQGKVTLNLLGDSVGDTEMKYGIASWNHKFKDTHLTLRLEKGELVVEVYDVFKDTSARANYRSKGMFKKSK